MPDYSALIVDDAPVNLKLADILLRKEGFRVYTARDAAEALSALGAARPDIMLVDVHLPGMDGLELTRCVKADPSTRDIVVLALVDSSSPAVEQSARDAGCEALIAKPLDPRTLAGQVRGYLERRPGGAAQGDAPAVVPEWLALTGAEMAAIRLRFLENGIRMIQQMQESAGGAFDARWAAGLARRWNAAGEALGFPGISAASRSLAAMLAEGSPGPARLRDTVNNLLHSFSAPVENLREPLPEAVLDMLAGKRIALAGFQPEDAERLCAALDRAGARPRLFEAAESPDFGPVKDCSLVMTQVRAETLASRWLAPDSPAPPGQPLLLVGESAAILEVDPAVRARAQDFLLAGWQAEEALMRCAFVLARVAAAAAPPSTGAPAPGPASRPAAPGSAGPPDVLVADDDPIVRSLLRGTLENYGMSCRLAASGPEALDMIAQSLPDAAVLDVNMPGLDGYLVLANIRERGLPLPVILLTARCHENDISRGFTLGADDYVIKPFNNVELVARLKRLLRR